MIKIAVIDDEPDVAQRLRTLVAAYFDKLGSACECNYFNDTVKFLEGYKLDYDIVFMDIRVPRMNGMKAAEKLREMDESVVIIFVTNMHQFAIKGYEVGALGYVIKPIDEFSLNSLMDKALRVVRGRRSDDITIKTKGGFAKINKFDIYYIEIQQHKITYHLKDREIESWGSLSEVEKCLPQEFFSRPNMCYIVNLKHISGVERDEVIVGDYRLKIARSRKKEFMADVAKFFGGE